MDQAPQEEAAGWDHFGGNGEPVDEGQDLYPNQHLMIAVISCNLVRGAGPAGQTTPWRLACPASGRHAAWWTWSPDKWAVQVDQEGGSHPGSAGG